MSIGTLSEVGCDVVFTLFTGGNDEACRDVSLGKMLSFCTGSEYPPPLGFDEPIHRAI